MDPFVVLVCLTVFSVPRSFCHFPIWRPRSGVVLDCIDYLSLL